MAVTVPRFFLDSGQFHPSAEIMVAGIIKRHLEYPVIVIVLFLLSDKADEHIVERNYHTAAVAASLCFLLLETQGLSGIVHIAISQFACITPASPCVKTEDEYTVYPRFLTIETCSHKTVYFS